MKYTVGDCLRHFRRLRGLTQAELGKRCGMADSRIGAYERGECKPGNRSLERLATGLDLTVEQLTAHAEETEVAE